MRPWFERDPDLLERELAALKAANIAFAVDDAAKTAGVLRLSLQYPHKGGSVALTATYPDFFPFFRPDVVSDDMQLPRHQHPLGGGLCLIGRATSRWFAEDTLASLLTSQMPALLKLHATGDIEAVVAVEEKQGEPASDYYNAGSVLGSYILIDSEWSIPPGVTRGTLKIRCRIAERRGEPPIVQGYVAEVLGSDHAILAEWTGPEPAGYDVVRTAPWVRRDAPILGDITKFVPALSKSERDHLENAKAWPPTRHVALAAVLFPEEVTHRAYADGWAMFQMMVDKRHRGQQRNYRAVYVRTARAGRQDLAARMPAVAPLADKTVAIFGLGANGAPAAIELARAGVGKLILIDHDVVEPSTVRRWPVGWSAFGRLKVDVLKERIETDYPWTTVETESLKVGGVDAPGGVRQGDRLAEILGKVDLVFDATAEMGVNHLLSALTQGRLPYVLANGTPGAWGGMVARFLPGDAACWMCLRHALYGDRPTIDRPPADPAGETQPPGCAEPTFTGTAFDMQEIGLESVRVIAGVLAPGDYPSAAGNISVVKLREGGVRIAPVWSTVDLAVHADCPSHDRS